MNNGHVSAAIDCAYYMCVRGGGFHSYSFSDRVKSKAFHLMSFRLLINCLQSIKLRRSVDYLFLFYRYHHANWSSDLINCKPSLLMPPRSIRLACYAHPYFAHTTSERVNRYLLSFLKAAPQRANFSHVAHFH